MLGKLFSFFIKISKLFSRYNLYPWLQDEISALNKQARHRKLNILNIGSGGEIHKIVSTLQNAEIKQIDIDEERGPDIVADICNMRMIKDNSVDAVFLMEVLEHVSTPQTGIHEIFRVLKPGGKLIMSTPFLLPIHDVPHDYYRYTSYGLKHLLFQFTNVTIRERNDYIHAWVTIAARSLKSNNKIQRLYSVLLFLYVLAQYPILWLFSRFYKNISGTTGYFTIAQKAESP